MEENFKLSSTEKMSKECQDHNIFMMCEMLNKSALTELSSEYYFRNLKPNELEIWKAFHFDSQTVPEEYVDFMNQFVQETYSSEMDTFYKNTILICDKEDKIISTCSHWKAYGKFHSIHWLKTRREYEGKGLGRAVLSKIMKRFSEKDYPIYLHTQTSSYKAIKLYSDIGFALLKGGKIGTRVNDLEKSLPILKKSMQRKHYNKLRIVETPNYFIDAISNENTIQF